MIEHAGARQHAEESPRGWIGFETRSALSAFALIAGALPFLGLMLLVRQEWAPLQELDQAVADGLNARANTSPAVVDLLKTLTDFGGNVVAAYVFVLTTAWFCIRRQWRLASFVATTGIGLAVIVPVTKALIGRERPQVLLPVAEIPSNASFPSGHAMVSVVTAGMLVLVLLPAVQRRYRPLLVTVALVLSGVVGFTRLALGVHFVSDVVAGWALGLGWLAVMTASFRLWQRGHGVALRPVTDGIDPQALDRQHAPARERLLPHGRDTVLRLVATAAAVWVLLTALGILITNVLLDTALRRWETEVMSSVVSARTPELSELAGAVTSLSGTPMVIAVSVATAVLALAVRASWRPVLFVATVVLGEVLLYFVTAQVVGRARPSVPRLTSDLPPGASWPSGHTAAAVAVYGSIAALVIVYGRHRWRWAALSLPVLLAPAIAATRVYLAAHHPTDVVAGLLLGTLWLLACVRYLLVPSGREEPAQPAARPGVEPAAPRRGRQWA